MESVCTLLAATPLLCNYASDWDAFPLPLGGNCGIQHTRHLYNIIIHIYITILMLNLCFNVHRHWQKACGSRRRRLTADVVFSCFLGIGSFAHLRDPVKGWHGDIVIVLTVANAGHVSAAGATNFQSGSQSGKARYGCPAGFDKLHQGFRQSGPRLRVPFVVFAATNVCNRDVVCISADSWYSWTYWRLRDIS